MAKRKSKIFDAVASTLREIVKEEAEKEEGALKGKGILKGKLIVRFVRSGGLKTVATRDRESVTKAFNDNTLFEGRGLIYDPEEDTILLTEFSGLLSSQQELIKSLGQTAVFVLNSSHLKDSQPLLYFKLKDAAVVLANLGN